MHQLNADQQNAAEVFTAFMVSDDKEMVISGPAGTGKTFLLKYLMNLKTPTFLCNLLGKEPIVDWALTATTNKAAEVLQEAAGIEARTIHSFLGLKVITDFDTGTQTVTRTQDSRIIYNTLIFVDEASMVDTPLRQLIDESTVNCKIVYIGDHCQMAPIKETISPVFADNNPVYLNTVVRAANAPPIMDLCTALRETVETGQFFDIQPYPGYIDFLTPDQARQEIQDTFLQDAHANARILCYTNDQVIGYNDYLRGLRKLPQQYTPGEWVISNSVVKACDSSSNIIRVEEELEVLDASQVTGYLFWVNGVQHSLLSYNIETKKGFFKVPLDGKAFRDLLKELARMAKKDKGIWKRYYELKENIADLRPRDACTVYKAQGSTYHTVFIDLQDIGTCTNPAQASRMLYVACSRPTDRICFLGELPDRFRGL